MITEHDKMILYKLICNEQIHMLLKKDDYYKNPIYKDLEELKIKIKKL